MRALATVSRLHRRNTVHYELMDQSVPSGHVVTGTRLSLIVRKLGGVPAAGAAAHERSIVWDSGGESTAQDLLQMVREGPCRETRVTIAWVALVCVMTAFAPRP